jgi:hypothetical protein
MDKFEAGPSGLVLISVLKEGSSNERQEFNLYTFLGLCSISLVIPEAIGITPRNI